MASQKKAQKPISRLAGPNPHLNHGFPGLAEPSPTRWEQYRSALRGVGRAVIRDSYPTEFASAAQTIQQPVSTGRRIAVLSPAGGTGASTLTSLAALALNGLRRDLIAAADLNNLTSGLMTSLAPQSSAARQTLGALSVAQPAQRAAFLSAMKTVEGDIITIRAGAYEKPLDARGTQTLLAELSRWCAVTLIECPPGGDDSRTVAVLERAHAGVVVVDLTEQGLAEGRALIERIRRVEGESRSDRIGALPLLIVANARTSGAQRGVRQARALAEESGARLEVLSHNRHLRRMQGKTFDSLTQRTKLEVLRIVARAMILARGEQARRVVARSAENGPALESKRAEEPERNGSSARRSAS